MRLNRWILGWLVMVCGVCMTLSQSWAASPPTKHEWASSVQPVKSSVLKQTLSEKTLRAGRLTGYFQQAAKEFGVPVQVLKAVGYAESRWMDHGGKPSQLNGYGIMHLADNPTNHSLKEAARLLRVPVKTLKTDVQQNIRGAAAVMAQEARRQHAGRLPSKLGDWYTVVAAYSGAGSDLTAKWYADEVFRIIQHGAYRSVRGEDVWLSPTPVTPNLSRYAEVKGVLPFATPDYPGASWVPANSGNYTTANREADGNTINYVIIHTTEGSYAGTISWFQNPSANVSAHYVIRSSDGAITQMVQNQDIAWHAGNWDYNVHSIGIEHEGYVNDPSWYTDTMYRASANLTRWICDMYGIPKDREHIIGHSEVPGATHTDPGPGWDWNYYMSLVTQAPTIIVDNATAGRFSTSANWQVSSWNTQKYGSDYHVASPSPVSDVAWYRLNIAAAGNYDIYAWWPANSGYNSATPFVIKTTTGNKTVYTDQRVNGGKWVLLGTYSLGAGDNWIIGVSRWTSGSGYVIADAVKVVKR
ncbi:N-acetylmuramoyl-L-alanine amidase [Polycladomyces subterraneus]|uniref:N-acetylmuramoyl-L-alanine amidase n=1 Tax=Polycladomyces subterraneus TaxID=1016997 RepID=A0ABT8IJG3_9BACL|nr:N-acetylmuramoyl-L-alanine amidase [Polycladomyces subterraneus]MDN4592925.1 N-acetylmuramoyl-L-alanine amidase [Polycladomyces subterraneus]